MSGIESLIKNWSFPVRSPERAQLTLRVPLSDYQRLLALKEVYPNRSINDMVVDILEAALNDIVSKLPSSYYTESELKQMMLDGNYSGEQPNEDYGLAGEFKSALARIQENVGESKEKAE